MSVPAIPPFRMRRDGALDLLCLEVAAADGNPGALMVVSTRRGGVSFGRGDLNLSDGTGDAPDLVLGNRGMFTHTLDSLASAPAARIAGLRQRHTADIHQVDSENVESFIDRRHEGDGMITRLDDVWLSISIGDCLPVMLYDPHSRVLGMVHAGWEGTAARIAEAAVEQMADEFGCNPSDLVAVLGPCIRPWRYQVDGRVFEKFRTRWAGEGWQRFLSDSSDGRGYLDLAAANRALLLENGLSGEKVVDFGLCTGALPALFFSHRRDDLPGGRMLALAALL
ncbi:MAG TPA: peptidoglycan editing factor PgeF [Acidobacteriota bacterium]|nr:peptidoglycan editing factor PgeF [Acidobacteriota bacterium]